MKKIAVIDCGTNTFNLLIATEINGHLKILTKKKRVVKLAEHNKNEITINKNAIVRAISTMTFYKKIIDREKIDSRNIYCVGTSAIRDATNSKSFINQIRIKSRINIQPINGLKEASYIFTGVLNEGVFSNETVLIMDIGGGSVEFIISKDKKIVWKKSFPIGAARILNFIGPTFPFSKSNKLATNKIFELELKDLFRSLTKFNPEVLIGSSGSFESLLSIRNKLDPNNLVINKEKQRLKPSSFNLIYTDLMRKNFKELLSTPGLIRMRAKMIIPSIMLIKFVLQKMNKPKIIVSQYSLKEGIAFTVLKDH
jgi:exopolyphosphatase/guanosine-5'-triphosphate,3'-diphosphate pyrophosphatase